MTNINKENSLARLHNLFSESLNETIRPFSTTLKDSMNDPNIGILIDDAFSNIQNVVSFKRLSRDDALNSPEINDIIFYLISYIESSILDYFANNSANQTPIVPGFAQHSRQIKEAYLKEIYN